MEYTMDMVLIITPIITKLFGRVDAMSLALALNLNFYLFFCTQQLCFFIISFALLMF